jgi:hypothetical protein
MNFFAISISIILFWMTIQILLCAAAILVGYHYYVRNRMHGNKATQHIATISFRQCDSVASGFHLTATLFVCHV